LAGAAGGPPSPLPRLEARNHVTFGVTNLEALFVTPVIWQRARIDHILVGSTPSTDATETSEILIFY
jgi:hypothetical protein